MAGFTAVLPVARTSFPQPMKGRVGWRIPPRLPPARPAAAGSSYTEDEGDAGGVWTDRTSMLTLRGSFPV
jgi:hypothetical protein